MKLIKFWTDTGLNVSYMKHIIDLERITELCEKQGKLRIVFLDLQQVLTSKDYQQFLLQQNPAMAKNSDWVGDEIFDPYSLELMNALLHGTDAYVIISSDLRKPPCSMPSGRFYDYIKEYCNRRGLENRIVGITPYVQDNRQKEIGYVQKHIFGYDHESGQLSPGSPLRSCVLIDDYLLDGGKRNIFVYCNPQHGFKMAEYEAAEKILMSDFCEQI